MYAFAYFATFVVGIAAVVFFAGAAMVLLFILMCYIAVETLKGNRDW